jgi:RNA polymerase sigma-70 factor (ECF subfamily)
VSRSPADTTLGGSGQAFPSTIGELLATIGDPASLETLCRRYWKPVYAYVRVAWKKSNEDAKDLAQAFFLWLVDGNALARFDPERGSFRGYLKTLLQRFVGHEEAALHRLKRGGGHKILSLDGEGGELPRLPADPQSNPERVFDQVWVAELLGRAMDRARRQCAAEGREVLFRVYEECSLGPGPDPAGHKEVAARLGIGEADVKRHLFNARERIRSCLREELALMTANDRELQDEWNRVLGS